MTMDSRSLTPRVVLPPRMWGENPPPIGARPEPPPAPPQVITKQMKHSKHEQCECPQCCGLLLLAQILERLNQMANSLTDLLSLTTAQTSLITSLQTFIAGLQSQIGSVGLTADQQAQVDQIFAGLTADNAALTAITANTPAATPVVPATVAPAAQ